MIRWVSGVSVLVHIPFLAAVASVASAVGLPRPWAAGILSSAIVVGLFVFWFQRVMPDRRRRAWTVALIDIPFFAHWCACMFAFVPSVAYTVFILPFRLRMSGAGYVFLADRFYAAAYAVGLSLSVYGIFIRRRRFQVQRYDVVVEGLPAEFDGYRIAHLSDLHIGSLAPLRWGMRWARAANDEHPDITVVTGDLVTSGTEYHHDIAHVIGLLRAQDGVYVSMGNHDYFGSDGALVDLLRAQSAYVLRNEGTTLQRGGAQVYIAAIDDTWTRRDDIKLALAGKPPGMASILLAHDPDRFPDAVAQEVSLTLSGHTHGGQIAVPFLYRYASLAHLSHKFRLGFYTSGRSTLYVHPGLGTTGPPLRLGIAPAVVILTLRTQRG